MRVLVCGGRDYGDHRRVYEILDKINEVEGITSLCEGGATGADRLGRLWAKRRRVEHVAYPADWATHGRAAGPIRNKWMLGDFKPDLVVAFPGGRGTEHMSKIAIEAGVMVYRVSEYVTGYVIVEEPG